MQNLIVASSLALLASTADAAMPKLKAVDTLSKHVRESMKAHEASIKTVDDRKAATVTAATEMKKEGVVLAESHDEDDNIFEIRRGWSDCDTTVGAVQGWETGRCMDQIFQNYTSAATTYGMGEGRSYMMKKPNSGGFPFVIYFEGHGCREENLLHFERMNKMDFGFPREYRAGACETVLDASGAPMLSYGAFWNNYRFQSTADHIFKGYDGREPGCRRDKFFSYETIVAGMCFESEDEYGGSEYEMFDVSECYMRNVTQAKFSDDACTVMVDQKVHHPEFCSFDYMEFNSRVSSGDPTHIEYSTQQCYQAGP